MYHNGRLELTNFWIHGASFQLHTFSGERAECSAIANVPARFSVATTVTNAPDRAVRQDGDERPSAANSLCNLPAGFPCHPHP